MVAAFVLTLHSNLYVHSDNNTQDDCEEERGVPDHNDEQEGHMYTQSFNSSSCQSKPSSHSPQGSEKATSESQISLNKATNCDSFELVETKREDDQSSPSADIYQPLSLHTKTHEDADAMSSECQLLTPSMKDHSAPEPPNPSKENAYQNDCEEQRGVLNLNDDQEGVRHKYTDSESINSSNCQSKPSSHSPQGSEKATSESQVSLNKATNCDSFELVETKREDDQSSLSAEGINIYQPLSLHTKTPEDADAMSSEYQSLTPSMKDHSAPEPPNPSKENAYQNLPCRSKRHALSKKRELIFEEVVIKKRKS